MPSRQPPTDAAARDQMMFYFAPGATMTVPRAAKLLRVSSQTVRNMIRTDELKGFKVRDLPGSPYRVLRDSVERHMRRIGDDYNLD